MKTVHISDDNVKAINDKQFPGCITSFRHKINFILGQFCEETPKRIRIGGDYVVKKPKK